MKKMMSFLLAALLLTVLPSCGSTTNTAASSAAESATISTHTLVRSTDEGTFTDPETTEPEESLYDAAEPYGQTFATVTHATETTTAPTTQSTSASESSADTTASTTAIVGDPTVATTAPSSEKVPSPTSRRSILDRILDNMDAGKGNLPIVPNKEFFNDAVFVGDSVTLGLKNYTNAQRNKGKDCLGTAQFLCVGSMSYTNVLGKVSSSSLHPTYKGEKLTVEEGLQKAGAGKVFIMLGMNDFSAYSDSVWMKSVETLISRIREKNPGIGIYIQSVTPILDGMEHGRFNNDNIRVFNDYLKTFCEKNDCTYVDINGEVMADDTGHLKRAYCGDPGAMGIHMSNEGTSAWASYLTKLFCGTES